MKVGYARPAKNDQDVSPQLDALKQAGCKQVFIDDNSRKDDSGLETALKHMRAGDILMVWRLDCLGRSLKHLVDVVNQLAQRKIGLQSLQDSLDTTSDGGYIYQIFASLALFQRNIVRARAQVGLQAARARGRKGGRPKALDAQQTELLYTLYDQKQYTIKELCQIMRISKPTLYTYLKERQEQ